MRILTVHADYIEVEPKKEAIKEPEALAKSGPERFEEVLVVFTAIEDGDEEESAAQSLAKESIGVADQVKTKNILLYPWVHLTSKPSKPALAKSAILKAEALLREKGYTASHSPFGWYKAFNIKSKGHPLSELSRELRATGSVSVKPSEVESVSKSLQQENQLRSRFMIMDLEGNLHEVDKFNFAKFPGLRKLATYETKKVRVYEKEPPHIKIMKEHSLIDYEPGSDSGNFRLLPKGRLMKKLMERAITDWCVGYGALEVETPLMYDYEHPSLKKYLNRFPARQYVVISDEKKLFLRFAACFGQFLIAHDMVFSHKHLPMKMFELTRYSFRREQSGELAGLKRLRAFTMPDMHTLVSDLEMARSEFERQYDMGMEWNKLMGLETDIAFRIQDDFFNENKEWYVNLVRKGGKPILVELFKERYAYFITKFEFNFVDSMDKASALTTVQIDVENAETYDINYTAQDGSRRRPYILHASISGSLERVIYAILEAEAMKMAEGKKANFPTWLSPTQVRIIPVSDKHKEHGVNLVKRFASKCVRVDVDDRDEPLGKKIRDAQKEWIPFVVVIGDKEMDSGLLSVAVRSTDEKKQMSVDELAHIIEAENHGKPFERLSLPIELSKRPII
ncbi:MAG: threonine--tRNA ligase [Candidatus Micrarchaeia archaeon]